jgi:endonuclease YncB( thermonuclease family)
MRIRLILAACALILARAPGFEAAAQQAAPAACAGEAGGESAIAEIADAQTLRLADGRFVRLANLYLPPPASGEYAFNATADAIRLLKALALGRKAALRYGGRRENRYGIHLAQVALPSEGFWLQERLIRSGLALYTSTLDNRACAEELLAAEAMARRDKVGLWRSGFFHVASATDIRLLREAVGSFQLVEGKAVSVSERGSGAYLNFASDWRRGFSVRLTPGAVRLLKSSGRKAADFRGKSLRVRGWLRWSRTPLIEADHPEQIEVLSGE